MNGSDMPTIPGLKVLRRLGRGGMSDVYEAEDPAGRHVAVKVFRNEKGSRFLEERFKAEARLLGTLFHPRIVRVHDFGIDGPTGRAWFVMDLVLSSDGASTTLEDVRLHGGVPNETLRQWYSETRDALEYLHKCGVVHRDVKLENILVDAEGHIRLADFGVSRIVDEKLRTGLGVGSTFVTGETVGTRPVVGTYFYLPPDVRAGKPATADTDRYALGVAFFRLLTGLWYEPGTDALALLAPFPEFWRREIPSLLGADRRRAFPWRAFAWVSTAVALFLVFAMAAQPGRRGRTQSSQPPEVRYGVHDENGWSLPSTFATPRVRSLVLGDRGEEMSFCACPAGSFMMSDVGGNGTTCHKVTITRPFWIGSTVVLGRDLRELAPSAGRDARAAQLEASFPDMLVASKLRGQESDDIFRTLNIKHGQELPGGYVFRLPTEAELEYALGEGGNRVFRPHEAWHDREETQKALADKGVESGDELRLLPCSQTNAWGVVTLWTDTEQSVLDTVDGKEGTRTAATSISYADEETDPLRAGALHLSRQFPFQRWLMRGHTGFVRVCIGPRLEPGTAPRQ